MPQSTFKRKAHAGFFNRCLTMMPAKAQDHDPNRCVLCMTSSIQYPVSISGQLGLGLE
jgi:hypothetical protein